MTNSTQRDAIARAIGRIPSGCDILPARNLADISAPFNDLPAGPTMPWP